MELRYHSFGNITLLIVSLLAPFLPELYPKVLSHHQGIIIPFLLLESERRVFRQRNVLFSAFEIALDAKESKTGFESRVVETPDYKDNGSELDREDRPSNRRGSHYCYW